MINEWGSIVEERSWKLGEDLRTDDNLLDPITFDELILTVHCNCSVIDRESVLKEILQLFNYRLDDTIDLLDINMDEIIRLAKEGRETS